MKAYYFGCSNDEVGHYLRTPTGSAHRETTPWGPHPDGTLAPKGSQAQGKALLHHKDGWTAIAFWDRSKDHRTNSNAVFMFDQVLDFNDCLREAFNHFPTIYTRITSYSKIELAE